ncbi:adventurous gliding motility lipoprotein CglC [Myxococcus sp. K15C18031901]|uniref:adventurous gliding motility lipoprotein CglC n=1 Tax=Myxococcus dinghuensis TaxID=2906761 RepID=UPI0020A7A73C|nr:adventurous gliding motility lipoprotein CglC [Myxococcus dinghuensis]MCP3097708.1 adventurous gliding motility lipoprotein CglC [Myxococcus dinghuensis]
MKKFVRSALILTSTALFLGGCKVSSEIGKPCNLVRKATPEELAQGSDKTVDMLEKEVTSTQDVVSFGAVECEDLICIRDSAYPRELGPDGNVNENAIARGYCSKPCVEGSNACEVKDTSDVEPNLPGRMACRPLLLDQDTLDAIRSADEAFYRRIFGENNSPYFCAGALPGSQGG